MEKGKVIYLDFGSFMFRSIFSWEKTKQNGSSVPASYTCLSSIIASLKKVGVDKENDIVIVAVDSKYGSWRKRYDKAYKAGRKEAREKHDIDWTATFAEFDELKERLKVGSPFLVCEEEFCEADDIISVGVRYFTDRENIISWLICFSPVEGMQIYT